MNNYAPSNTREREKLSIPKKIVGMIPLLFTIATVTITLGVYLYFGTLIMNNSTSSIKGFIIFNTIMGVLSILLIIANIIWRIYRIAKRAKEIKYLVTKDKVKNVFSIIGSFILMIVFIPALLFCALFYFVPFNPKVWSDANLGAFTFKIVDEEYLLVDCGDLKEVNVARGFDDIFISSKRLEKIVVNDDCTYVEFTNCYNLEQVVLGKGITEIPHNAFWRCESLKSIISKSNVQSIGESAFFGCRSLDKLILPESVAYIGKNAFELCESLQTIDLGDSLKRIEENTFSECRELFYVNIPATVQSINSQAFANCAKLKHIGFKGSKAQWNNIQLAPDWVDDTTGIKVYCNDGVLTLD